MTKGPYTCDYLLFLLLLLVKLCLDIYSISDFNQTDYS